MEGMQRSAAGMVMNQNTDRLPKDCASISQDVAITVHAGRKYAAAHPGDSRLDARIAAYELAARLQQHATEALDLAREPAAVHGVHPGY